MEPARSDGLSNPHGPADPFLNRVLALSSYQNVSTLSTEDKLRNLRQLEELGREVERELRSVNVELYGSRSLRIVDALANFPQKDASKAKGLAIRFAQRALEKADEFSLDLHCSFLGYLSAPLDEEGNRLSGKAWARQRKEYALLWLRAYQRIEQTIDPAWDPDDVVPAKVMPPGSGAPDADPRAISDPVLRARYEAAIEANREQKRRYLEQYRARWLQEKWLPKAEFRLINLYSSPPERRAELRQLLEEYVSDPERRREIMGAVEKEGMPERLERRFLRFETRPAQEGPPP
ncbi:MAG: hypothetical protein AMXMBFR13_21470 [Phycisphaerae bacterium]